MDARALQSGFSLGEWLIEPRALRASSGDAAVVVTVEQMQVLLCLVEGNGAFVDRRTLSSRAFAKDPDGDQQLREAILAWHTVFGDSARRPRYIAAIGRDGYSLVASLGPMKRRPVPERLMAVGLRNTGSSGIGQTMVRNAHYLLGELRRRRVFRVSASYLIGMWVLLQVAEVTFAPLHLPAWWITALTILTVIGLPIIMVLAWTYEITSDGVVRDSYDIAAAFDLPTSRRLVAPSIIVGLALMAAVTGFAWWESIR